MGNKPFNALGENTTDHYGTPWYAVRPLLPFLPKKIWEPCNGPGSLTAYLRRKGHKVVTTCITKGQDFLTCPPPAEFDAIVTNPPYSIKNSILRRCLDYGKPFALLVPFGILESEDRHRMFRRYPGFQLLIPNDRVKFIRVDGSESSPNTPTLWLCHNLGLPRDLNFCQLSYK